MRIIGLAQALANAAALTLGGALVGLGVANTIVHVRTRGRVHDVIARLPTSDVALVLGCAPSLSDGRPNFYFETRLDAAAQLFHSGRVQRLILSGGPLRRGATGASECDAMLDGLTSRGVPRERLTLDRLGTRTWRSIVHVRDVYQLNEVTIVSQAFHLPRAVYLAAHAGVRACGYAARSPRLASRQHQHVLLREVFARARAVVDVRRSAHKKTVPGREPYTG